jgi:hypothetical protein
MRKQFFLFAPLIAAAVAVFVSCTNDSAINKVLGAGTEAPVYISHKVTSGREVDFEFSVPVKIVEAKVRNDSAAGSEVPLEPFKEDYDTTVPLCFSEDNSGGDKVTADIVVEDAEDNSLDVLVSFRTRNDNLPELMINEIRTTYTSKESSEFIELFAKTSGNLGALRLFSAYTSTETPIYEFPSVEVAAGEYITLHLRTLEGDTAVDELGNDLSLSKAKRASDTKDNARDLWLAVSEKRIDDKADVIYLLDQDDNILDMVVLAVDAEKWDKFTKAAEPLKRGAWRGRDGQTLQAVSFADVVNSTGLTMTRTLCRNEAAADSNTAADWYVCNDKGASPGAKNSEKRYDPTASKSVSKKK